MKHLWKAAGICENKFTEAVCQKCNRQEDAGCHWLDTDGQVKFWNRIDELDDCPVKGEGGICKFPTLGKNARMGRGYRVVVPSDAIIK